MTKSSFLTLLAFAPFVISCDGASNDPGADQPLVVVGAQFRSGPLPGEPLAEGGVPEELHIVTFENPESIIRFGQAGKAFSGRAGGDVVAIGVAIAGLGDSHWVFPVGAEDGSNPGTYGFNFVANFGSLLPAGDQELQIVAIDGNGRAGTIYTRHICILPDVPDNASTCIASTPIPDTVISLSWNVDVDLDLVIVTPEGKVVTGKRPNTTLTDGGLSQADLTNPANGQFTRDSNAQCVIDSVRRESIVFRGPPPAGTYLVYARFTNPCGRNSVVYHAETFRAEATDGGPATYTRVNRVSGDFLALQATGATGLGTFVTQISFP